MQKFTLSQLPSPALTDSNSGEDGIIYGVKAKLVGCLGVNFVKAKKIKKSSASLFETSHLCRNQHHSGTQGSEGSGGGGGSTCLEVTQRLWTIKVTR